jgi:hypothetical protein
MRRIWTRKRQRSFVSSGKVSEDCVSNSERPMRLSPVYQSCTGGRQMPQDRSKRIFPEDSMKIARSLVNSTTFSETGFAKTVHRCFKNIYLPKSCASQKSVAA